MKNENMAIREFKFPRKLTKFPVHEIKFPRIVIKLPKREIKFREKNCFSQPRN